MAFRNVHHPFDIQFENGGSLHFEIGSRFIPDDLLTHPRVIACTEQVAAEEPEPVEPVDERIALREKASELGISFDGRWNAERLRQAISDAEKD